MITIDNVNTKIDKYIQIQPYKGLIPLPGDTPPPSDGIPAPADSQVPVTQAAVIWGNNQDRCISPPKEILRNTSTTGQVLRISTINVCVEKILVATADGPSVNNRIPIIEPDDWTMYKWGKRDRLESVNQGEISFLICEGNVPSFSTSLFREDQINTLEQEIMDANNVSFLSQFRRANKYPELRGSTDAYYDDYIEFSPNIYLKPNSSLLFYAKPIPNIGTDATIGPNGYALSRIGYSITTSYQNITIT